MNLVYNESSNHYQSIENIWSHIQILDFLGEVHQKSNMKTAWNELIPNYSNKPALKYNYLKWFHCQKQKSMKSTIKSTPQKKTFSDIFHMIFCWISFKKIYKKYISLLNPDKNADTMIEWNIVLK